ncbi:uncharacterized protein LOC126819754 [Patella vulgata]|uniref:uncharacterized protein LOC126819754 n=1 Tax=Patella vulgata TaxID=6465 RepID=UPI00217F2DFC|nr:uncharacterized protein LOC126819754 [Patella vulgata]XP_050404000.1 uncharacterized protein LOC126819754 [Patella vulgata]
MSKYGQWFQDSDYESGYGNKSSGKRKRDDFMIGGGSFGYGNNSSGYGSTTGSGYGSTSGSGYGSTSGSGYGATSGSGYGSNSGSGYGSGAGSRYGGNFGNSSAGSSFGTGSGYGGGGSMDRYGTSDKFDSFLSTQNLQMNEMSKKLRKMEMMQQIAELEAEGDEEEALLRQRLENLRQQKRMRGMSDYGDGGYGGGYGGGGMGGGGGYGRRSLLDLPTGGRMGRMGSGQRWGAGRMEYEGRRGGSRDGRGRREGRQRTRRGLNNRKKNAEDNPTHRTKHNAPRTAIKAINTKGRDQRIKKLMEKMKTFKDKSDETATLHSCIKVCGLNIDVFYYQKFGCIYLDGILFGRGLAKPYKQLAYKDTIYKLRNLTLEEVYEKAKEMGKLAHMPTEKETARKPSEDPSLLVCPLEFSELPFLKRLELLAEQIKKSDHIMVCLKIYCTKYFINMMCVYHFHPEEAVDKHEYRMYANDVFLTSTQGRLRKRVEHQAMKSVQELFQNKTLEEIMENDGQFTKDYNGGFPDYVSYRGCGSQVESNAFQLRFHQNIEDLDSIVDRKPEEIILMEKNLWRGSKFRILEESASYCHLLIKWIWDVESNPEVVESMETEEEKKESNGNDDEKKNEDKTDKGANFEPFDPVKKRKEVIEQAKTKKCNVINCKVLLQGREIGYGSGTTRNQATRMASAAAIKELSLTQTMLHHTDQDTSSFNKVYKFVELKARAEALKVKQPEAPVFEAITNAQLFDGDEVMDQNAEEDFNTDIKEDTKKEEGEPEDELAPWLKEVVRQDMEELSQVDEMIEGALTYLETPKYIRDLAGHFCQKYNLEHKSKFQNQKLISLNIHKITPNIEKLVERLMTSTDHKAYGYTLQQIKKEDGTIEVVNKLNNLRKSRRR